MAPEENDLGTIYPVELTGRDIDQLGNLIDAWVKQGGLQVAPNALALLEKITASRKAAMATGKAA